MLLYEYYILEAHTILSAAEFSRDLGIQSIILEGNSL